MFDKLNGYEYKPTFKISAEYLTEFRCLWKKKMN